MDIGIDLGTTFSVIAVKGRIELAPGYSGAEYLEEIDVTILPSPTGNPTIPSVMWWEPDPNDPTKKEKGRYIFGDEAKQMAEEGKSPIMFSKRSIGTNEDLMLNGQTFKAMEVAERFLRYMREWAETVTGQKVGRAVVTHPAYFKPNQREETLKAAQAAGLGITPEQLMMEPCAAAMAYTVNDTRDPLRVMTYDLGGGTFDVAVMEKIQGVIRVKKFHGNHLLGGYDFDKALVQWILDELKAAGKTIPYDESNEEHRGRRARMLQVAETVKIRLSEQKTDKIPVTVQVDFLVDDQGQKVQFRKPITREQYAALIQDKLKSTIECCLSALEGAEMKPEDLHTILLVGGSTHGKWVKDAVAMAFGGIASEPYHPDEIVAAGAALCVAQLTTRVVGNNKIMLTLDYQSKSVLRSATIAGSVVPAEGSDLTPGACRTLEIYLDTPEGERVGPAEIGDKGNFVFKNVAVADDGTPSTFKVTVNQNGQPLFAEEGTITYSEAPPPPPPPPPVLPRPLFLKAERMVPIADEGAQLPVKCHATVYRAFGGPTEKILIFMAGDEREVGFALVEGIPDEAGEGCKVELDVEVTTKYEMVGRVLVYGSNGKTVVKEGPVRISFPPIEIPELADLLGQFDQLKDDLEQAIVHGNPQDRARLAGPGRSQVKAIKRLTEEQAPDRQPLAEAIKKLRELVHPKKDDMEPPRTQFDNLVAECRELIAEDQSKKSHESQVNRVEKAGQEAYDTKNNRKWTTANETLQRIHQNLIKTPDDEKRPQPKYSASQWKTIAEREIQGLRAGLNAAWEARVRSEKGGGPKAERWKAPSDECERRLDHMASEVKKIPDNADSDQAQAQVQSYLAPAQRLRATIQDILDGTTLTSKPR